MFRLLENLPNETPPKAMSGPWGHIYPHLGVPAPAIGFLPEALRWWDRWLKNIDNGIDDDDPLSVRAEYTCECGVGRGDWQTRTKGRLTMTCSADTFFVTAELDAYEGEQQVFSRNWGLKVPRDGF